MIIVFLIPTENVLSVPFGVKKHRLWVIEPDHHAHVLQVLN